MAQTTAYLALAEEDEQFRILHWRLSELVRGGFDPKEATELALHVEIDLHQALELVRAGCPAETAARILL
jgi:hypothetical protein